LYKFGVCPVGLHGEGGVYDLSAQLTRGDRKALASLFRTRVAHLDQGLKKPLVPLSYQPLQNFLKIQSILNVKRRPALFSH